MMGFLDSLFGGGGGSGGGMDAGGFLSSLGSGLSNNSNALTDLGSGLLSGGNWKQGLANAAQGWQQGHQLDRYQNIQKQTSAAAKSLLAGSNLAPGIQQAIQANPELAQQFIGAQLKPHTYGFQSMPDGTLIRTDELAGTASPAYQAAPKMVFNTVGNSLVASDPTSGKSQQVASGGGSRPMTPQERTAYGIDPNAPAFMDANGKPGILGPQSVVNMNNNAESKFDQTVGEGQGNMFLSMAKDGPSAQSDLSRIQVLGQNLSKLPGGLLGNAQAIANSWGIKVGPNASNVEAANALISQLTPAQRDGMPGAASDRDTQMFRDALPKMSNTPEGNQLILSTMQGLAQNRAAQAKIATAVTTGQMTRADAMKALQTLPDPFADVKKSLTGKANVPSFGDVEGGYRFKGGDPSKQSNWEKAN